MPSQETIRTPEQQDAAYANYMSEYQASLQEYNSDHEASLVQATINASGIKQEQGVRAFYYAHAVISDSLNVSKAATAYVAAGIEEFYGVATPQDTETLDKAAAYFYNYEYKKAYELIDSNASSATARRAMRTAMDRFTLDVADNTLAESRERIIQNDTRRVSEIYDFIRNYASSTDAQKLMFSVVDEHVNAAISVRALEVDAVPTFIGKNSSFLDSVASSERSRRALRAGYDAVVLRKVDSQLGQRRFSDAERYASFASGPASSEVLIEYIGEEKKEYVASKIAMRRLNQTQPKEMSAESSTVDVVETEPQLSIEVGRAEKAHRGEDTILQNDEKGLYGVFDGMGSNAGDASSVAAHAIDRFFAHSGAVATVEQGLAEMKAAFNYARETVIRKGHGGVTTAVAARVVELDGSKYVFTATAGDSRMIFRDQKGNQFDMTPDQSEGGRFITNGFGPKKGDWPHETDQFNYYEVFSGDRVLICSDGITGDNAQEALSDEEFTDAFGQSTAQASADRFLELSKKNDDKSALVLYI